MAKKRMILEEVEEQNPLVPGSLDNPIKLGEKAKNLLIQMKLYEDDGRAGSAKLATDYEHAQARERLEFLKLIEFRPQFNIRDLERFNGELYELKALLSRTAMTGTTDECRDILHKMIGMDAKLLGNYKIAWLTAAGRDILIKGTVTVSV